MDMPLESGLGNFSNFGATGFNPCFNGCASRRYCLIVGIQNLIVTKL